MWTTILFSTLYLLWTTLQAHSRSVTTPESGDTSDCSSWLTTQINTCLMQFEDLLFVYQQSGTSEAQRQDMVTGMCHEYREALQCLHFSLLRCEPDIASLQVIATHLGPVRTFMEVTCYIAPRRVTPTPRGSHTRTTDRKTEQSPSVYPTDVATKNSGYTTETTHTSTRQLGSGHGVSDTSNPVTTPVDGTKRELRTDTKQSDTNTDGMVDNLALTDGVNSAAGIRHCMLVYLGALMSVITMRWFFL